jgi:hypothetical protein
MSVTSLGQLNIQLDFNVFRCHKRLDDDVRI